MFSHFESYANKKQLYGYITVHENTFKKFCCVVIDFSTGKTLEDTCFEARDIQILVDKVPSPANYNNCYKAIVVNLFDLDLQSTPLRHISMDTYCEKLKQKFDALEIPCYFITPNNFVYSSLLIATDLEVYFDETIVIVLPRRTHFGVTIFTVGEFIYTPNGYQLIHEKDVEIDFKANRLFYDNKFSAL